MEGIAAVKLRIYSIYPVFWLVEQGRTFPGIGIYGLISGLVVDSRKGGERGSVD